LCASGELHSQSYGKRFTNAGWRPQRPIVQLRACTIPYLRLLVVHCFFIAYDPRIGAWERWEVWQTADAGGTSYGHVHKDLLDCDSDTGGGPPFTLAEWRDHEARRLLDVLHRPESYAYARNYHYWPGPNSNTYVAWVLREAQIPIDLPPQAVGKDYLGVAGAGLSPTGAGIQIETPVIGLTLGLSDGIELHVLCLTLGADVWPPAVKTPLGRFGFDE
jgi:hypothetical protein